MLLIKKISNFSGIYKIINLTNNKIYIGSAINIYQRTRIHLWYFRNDNHQNKHLQSAWNKYGEESFSFEILEKCSKKELLIREQYYIDTLNPEYNICRIAGSNLGIKKSEKSKLKQSLAIKGRKYSGEHKLKISLTNKGISRGKGILKKKGYKRSKESINNQIKSRSFSILKLNSDYEILEEYPSIKIAKEKTGRSAIWFYCNNVNKDSQGYIWKYKQNYLSLKLVDTVPLETIKLNDVEKIVSE